MYRKFGIDITVYDKKDRIEAYAVTIFLIAFAGLITILVRHPSIREYCIVGLSLFYSLLYIYYFATRKETFKLFFGAISLGIIIGSFLLLLVLIISDIDTIFKATISMSLPEKFRVFSNYFSASYMNYLLPLLFILIANIFRLSMKGKFNALEKTSGIYGSAMMADGKYLKENNIINDRESLFGRDIETKKLLSYQLCNRTVISKPGGGKTTGVTIPALLTENRPVFVHDPKGELWVATSRYRIRNFNRKIITIDPFGVTLQQGFRPDDDPYAPKLERCCINPLLYFSDSDSYRDRFLTSLTSSVVKSDCAKSRSEVSDHFIEHTQILLGAFIELVLNVKTKPEFRSIISELLKKYEELLETQKFLKEQKSGQHMDIKKPLSPCLEKLFSDNTPPSLMDVLELLNQDIHDIFADMKILLQDGSIRQKQAASTLLSTGESERGSILSTTRRQLIWLADKNLRETFSQNTCDLKDFISGKADIYIIMPEDQINTQSRAIRMLMSITQSLLVQEDLRNLSKKHYLFLLDELGQLDYNPDIEQSIAILRGRKCVFWSIFQTYSQIEQYRKPDLFIDTGLLQFFSIGDPKIMQLIQKLGGKQTKIVERNNHGQSSSKPYGSIISGNSGENNSCSTMEVQADLLHLNEIRELPRDEQLVFIDGLKPIRCKKLKYYSDPFFKDYDSYPGIC